ncbi:MAG: Do family serine endopeptidase [Muribaculaceae bacterium]
MKRTLILSALAIAALCGVQAQIPAGNLSQQDFINAAEATVNGVVSVKSYATVRQQAYNGGGFFDDPFFQYFFGQPQQQPQQPQQGQRQVGLGSGVIISTDGYIVTNNHVIEGAERLEVTLNDNRNFTASIVGSDPVTDLALIRIEADSLHAIPMGDSDELHVGEWVLAVGNPFGFTSSVTAGIVSAKARNISSSTQTRSNGGIEAYIQTDAAVNRGNSGGALVNLRGELVGINTAIYSQTGTYAGCSFAIPTSIVRKVTSDLMEYGSVQRAVLGISYVELTPEFISEQGLTGVTRGIYVAEVMDGSAALEAGLQPGDVITHIDNTEVVGTASMQEVMARLSPGTKVTITYVREGKAKTATCTLRNSEGNTNITTIETPVGVLGATFAAPSDEVKRNLQIAYGVQVTITSNTGRMAQAGIRSDFIIVAINNVRVKSPEDVETIYNAIREQNNVYDRAMFITGVYPSGQRAQYIVDLSE